MRLDLLGNAYGGSEHIWRNGQRLELGAAGTAGNPQVCNGQPIFQHCDAKCVLATSPPFTEVDGEGQSQLFAAAGANFWARMLPGRGYKDSRGLERADWAPLAVDDKSARVVVVTVADNQLWLWDADANTLTLISPAGLGSREPGDVHCADGIVGWREGGQYATWGRSAPRPIPDGYGVRFSGEYVLEGQSGRGLTIRRWDDTHGLVLTAADAFNPDIKDLGHGQVVVSAGKNRGDEGEPWRFEIDWAYGTVNDLPAMWVDLSVRPVTVIPMPRQTHAVKWAVYKDPFGTAPAPAIEIVVNHGKPFPGREYFVGDLDSSPTTVDPYFLGFYAEANTPTIARQWADDQRVRILHCHDGPDDSAAPVALLKPWDIAMREFYRDKAETRAQSKARWFRQGLALLAEWPYQCGFDLMAFAMGGVGDAEVWTETEMLEALADGLEVANALGARFCFGSFFEWLRGNGASAHPALEAAIRDILAHAPAAPILLQVGEVPDAPAPQPKPDPKPNPTPVPAPGPVPAPIPEETNDMALPKVGDKGGYREMGSTALPTNATIVECQDDGYLSLVDDKGLVQFDTNTGKISGHKPGVTVGTGAERIKFQSTNPNVFTCRAGDLNNGPLLPYEWYER